MSSMSYQVHQLLPLCACCPQVCLQNKRAKSVRITVWHVHAKGCSMDVALCVAHNCVARASSVVFTG